MSRKWEAEGDPAFVAAFTSLVLLGKQSPEIAEALGICRSAVYRHADRLDLKLKRFRDWTPEKAVIRRDDPATARAWEEVKDFLEILDADVALSSDDPRYPVAHRDRIAAVERVKPYLTAVGIVVDGRRVSRDCLGDVVVSRHRKFVHSHAGPRSARVASPERAARIGGESR